MLDFPRWKVVLIACVCAFGFLASVPNLFSRETAQSFPGFMSNQINLGLDLQGGSHLLLEVESEAVFEDRLEAMVGDVRATLRGARILYGDIGLRGGAVVAQLRDPTQREAALDALAPLNQQVGVGSFQVGQSGDEFEITIDESGALRIVLSELGETARRDSAVQQSLEVVRRRIDELGTREPTIQRQGLDRILVQVPGERNPEAIKRLLGQTARLTFHMVDLAADPDSPGASRLVYPDIEDVGPDGQPRRWVVERTVEVSGESLVDAQPSFDQNNQPAVSFRFDQTGARKFGEITAEHTGELFAIVLDDQVISAPRINEPILGGSGIITGNFTVENANELAVLLRAGALPAPLTVLEERSVGPDLGQDSIDAGSIAGVISILLVAGFMALHYKIFGGFAVAALFTNLVLLAGALSTLGATLTLPGIAGIVLTVGMAVDANVLIFERIREENRAGRTPLAAIDAGYKQAMRTIVDANVTTLIAAVLLFQFGSGPVKGFAVTLAIGILTSMFTAITLTRYFASLWFRRVRPKTLQAFRFLNQRLEYGFMALRRPAMMASSAAAVLSILLLLVSGLNFGIDFRGGILMEVRTQEPADLGAMRRELNDLGLGEVALQEFGQATDILMRIERQEGEQDAQLAAVETVKEVLGEDVSYRRTEFVGPKVSGELLQAGVWAITLALLAVMVYIWLRFEWQFGVGAIIALAHDVILTVGLFALTGMEFNLATVAAVLTIVGYSLNDTVVVYDRVRENLRRYKKLPLPELIDRSLSDTLARTIVTSLTTLLALIALYLFGGEVIRGFTFAMIWGVLIGTYSSLFVAAPALLFLDIRRPGEVDKSEGGDGKEPAPGAA